MIPFSCTQILGLACITSHNPAGFSFFNALSFYSMIALSSICFQKKSLFLETDALFRVFLQTLDMQRDIAGLGFRQFQIIFSS